MRRASAVPLLAILAGIGLGSWRPWLEERSMPERACLPPHLVGEDAHPTLWLFVRPGCPHCAVHLQALQRSLAALSPAERAARLARVHVVGASTQAPAGACREPEALRTVLAVRRFPTTWLVDGDGRVREVWRGARGSTAWARAFSFLDAGEIRP